MKKLFLTPVLLLSSNAFGYSEVQSKIYRSAYGLNSIKAVSPIITISESGEQRIYFDFNDYNFNTELNEIVHRRDCDELGIEKDTNIDSTMRRKDTIFNVNGVNVKMVTLCSEYRDTKNPHVMFTPLTDRGANYVITQFKQSNSVRVKAELLDVDFNFSAKGFSKSWNSHGGDAI